MSDNSQISKNEAIRQVVAEGTAMDYVDVVDRVREKYGLTVSAVLVEKLHSQMRKETENNMQPRINLELQANRDRTEKEVVGRPQADDLVHALHYVKSVNGLKNAKRTLAELEVLMQDGKD